MSVGIVVIDDDVRITSMLERSLAFEGYVVHAAQGGEEGIQHVRVHAPSLVILDVMMPHMDGWTVCRTLRQEGCDVPILMLTARDDVTDRVRGLNVGADDYVVKPFALEELLARIRALLRRAKRDKTTDALTVADVVLDVHARTVVRGARHIDVTAKEFELLRTFMLHPRHVLSRDRLMDAVWGYDYSGSSNVLEAYVAMLRQKLEQDGEPRLIQTVRGMGYVMRERDERS